MSDSTEVLTIELAMIRAQHKLLSEQALLWTLAASSLVVPTPDGNFTGESSTFVPLLVRYDEETLLVVFTDPRRMGRYVEKAPRFIQMFGRDVILGIQPETGLVVNPESDLSFELPWETVSLMQDELRLPDTH